MLFVILAWAYVMKTMNRPENAKLSRGRSTKELCGTYANLLWTRTEEHNNQLKWKQRLHHLFPLRALLLHKLRSLKEEMLRYQVNSQSDASANADRDEDERSFDLGGVSHCSSSLPWQPYETYLSGCLHCSAIVILHVQCWEPRTRSLGEIPESPTKVAQLSAVFPLLLYAIYHSGRRLDSETFEHFNFMFSSIVHVISQDQIAYLIRCSLHTRLFSLPL